MKILLAFDKFKGALTAAEACDFAAEAIARLPSAGVSVIKAPLTDGGEGFCSIVTNAAGGTIKEYEVDDPLGRPVRAPIGWIAPVDLPAAAQNRIGSRPGERIAVIEMSTASGLQLLRAEERDPWKTTTIGTGQLLRKAVESGADRIVLGVGGSATNDCGAGALEALGVRFRSENGDEIRAVSPARFRVVENIDFSGALPLPPVVIASDVQSPLLGEAGATRVFGPQKGLVNPGEMEPEVEALAAQIQGGARRPVDASRPGMGAAGGISFGLSSLAEVRIEPGFSLVSDWLGLDAKLRDADWVVTGEGRLDRSSLTGKGPVALARDAVASGARVVLFAGAVESGVPEALAEDLGQSCECVQLSDPQWPLQEALEKTRDRLVEELIRWRASTETDRR